MSLHTNLAGRLRNTNLPKTHGLLPVFEAVVNSIQALEETDGLAEGQITLEIIRNPQQQMHPGKGAEKEIIKGFTITDNGVGFNAANMESFETLDSDHKVGKGCRGIGRLMWLKAFDIAEVESVFCQEGKLYQRNFSFSSRRGVQTESPVAVHDQEVRTVLKLDGLDKEYYASCRKTPLSIAEALLEHCLWYYVRSPATPNIVVKDGTKNISLSNIYDRCMHSAATAQQVSLKGYVFELTHIKFRVGVNKNHSMFLCAANRVVKEESIGKKVPGLFGTLSDDAGEFTYACYVTSDYLDEHVRSERTAFNIAETIEDLISDQEISLSEIREVVVEKTREYLSDYLHENMKAGKERVNTFVAQKAPRYRSIMSHMDERELVVDPRISDKELESLLHRHYYEAEKSLMEEGHEIMNPALESNLEDYQSRLSDYLRKAQDFKQSDLANYVTHRRTIIDLLEKYIERLDDDKYAREDLIHQLIMPMRMDSTQTPFDACNLWLIDERLAFHDYLASDKPLSSMPVTGDISGKEPDLCALNVCNNPILVSDKKALPLASITVVEIKRPMRNDAREGEDKDPIEQALSYLDRIREGQAKTAGGRLIPNSRDIPGFCYVICDLTPSVVQRCRIFDLTPTHDHMGYFGYSKSYGAFIEVISYNRLVQSVKERNKAFFDKLGLPST
ncbi:ATP-binding protein [Endozoicomonas sp. 8E]|uniref:ATP-binding protein n=1 Tax=Endozoicomonas sp. 8E TaxID=3035692 RepID=UPI0029390571|nr:ATP-binding protein [Endozoicomonas sp. 8E]WOG28303.1 ATP-binding protein [Endozoicomonas sp. 8E]